VDIFAFNDDVKASDRSARCLQCHQTNHDMDLWEVGAHNRNEVSCDSCHDLHAYSGEQRPNEPEICFSCHRDVRVDANKRSRHAIIEDKISVPPVINRMAVFPSIWSGRTIPSSCATPAMPKSVVLSFTNIHRWRRTADTATPPSSPRTPSCLPRKFPTSARTVTPGSAIPARRMTGKAAFLVEARATGFLPEAV